MLTSLTGLPGTLMGSSRRAFLRTLASVPLVVVSGCTLLPDTVKAPVGERPRTGVASGRAEELADGVDRYLANHHIPGAGIAFALEDGPVIAGGVGWQSPKTEIPVRPESLFRIASLSKPLTAAAIRHLVADGALSLADHALSLLPVEPPGCELADPRVADITVRHLLFHQGGWDRQESFDPMIHQVRVAHELGVEPPPTKRHIARYLLSRKLDFAPGTERAYANVGYLLLGLIIETVSGCPYQAYVRDTVLAAADVDPSNLQLGRTRPENRPAREVAYAANNHCRDVFGSHPLDRVPCPEGGFAIEPMAAHGGHIATAGAYTRFFRKFNSLGQRREESIPGVANGALPGTITVAVHSERGRTGVVLCNRRTSDPGRLRLVLWRGLAAIK
jgi:CubicO group peptidase (beta-lactamase class C family)